VTSTRLEMLRAERDLIEGRDDWANPALGYLNDTITALEAEERAKPPAATPTTEPEADPVAALASEMQAMLANPGRYSDAQHDQAVTRFNQAVIAAGQTQAERVDIQALTRDMAAAGADPGALSKLDDDQRADLLRRYNRAAVQRPERRTSEVLRGDLAGGDLPARMRAATELQARGELDDSEASAVVDAYNSEVSAAGERGLDVAALPAELQEPAKAILAAQAALEIPPDPADAALHQLNQAIRSMKPASLEEQLEGLGVQAEPEPESVGTTSQEA